MPLSCLVLSGPVRSGLARWSGVTQDCAALHCFARASWLGSALLRALLVQAQLGSTPTSCSSGLPLASPGVRQVLHDCALCALMEMCCAVCCWLFQKVSSRERPEQTAHKDKRQLCLVPSRIQVRSRWLPTTTPVLARDQAPAQCSAVCHGLSDCLRGTSPFPPN